MQMTGSGSRISSTLEGLRFWATSGESKLGLLSRIVDLQFASKQLFVWCVCGKRAGCWNHSYVLRTPTNSQCGPGAFSILMALGVTARKESRNNRRRGWEWETWQITTLPEPESLKLNGEIGRRETQGPRAKGQGHKVQEEPRPQLELELEANKQSFRVGVAGHCGGCTAIKVPVDLGGFRAYLTSNIHHPSPITHHPSPITHHPSPITHHPSPTRFFLTSYLT
ncbi:hypothetical protein GGR53DRAFT_162230 [Hypoxylon sp. FL1150]|nr:hypothetical protein GGR53DRAFT_162230 [Hypoxylon sp. FL1150]